MMNSDNNSGAQVPLDPKIFSALLTPHRSLGATGFGLLFLVFVLGTLLAHGIGALSPTLFTQTTPPPGSAGGLINAIFGSVAMTALATLIGTPTGTLAGTFLAEYAHGSRGGEFVRFINDILLSAPSIIIGLFVYAILVVPMGHFSAWAGAVALAIIVIPPMARAFTMVNGATAS